MKRGGFGTNGISDGRPLTPWNLKWSKMRAREAWARKQFGHRVSEAEKDEHELQQKNEGQEAHGDFQSYLHNQSARFRKLMDLGLDFGLDKLNDVIGSIFMEPLRMEDEDSMKDALAGQHVEALKVAGQHLLDPASCPSVDGGVMNMPWLLLNNEPLGHILAEDITVTLLDFHRRMQLLHERNFATGLYLNAVDRIGIHPDDWEATLRICIDYTTQIDIGLLQGGEQASTERLRERFEHVLIPKFLRLPGTMYYYYVPSLDSSPIPNRRTSKEEEEESDDDDLPGVPEEEEEFGFTPPFFLRLEASVVESASPRESDSPTNVSPDQPIAHVLVPVTTVTLLDKLMPGAPILEADFGAGTGTHHCHCHRYRPYQCCFRCAICPFSYCVDCTPL
jgi:hypothetical protein